MYLYYFIYIYLIIIKKYCNIIVIILLLLLIFIIIIIIIKSIIILNSITQQSKILNRQAQIPKPIYNQTQTRPNPLTLNPIGPKSPITKFPSPIGITQLLSQTNLQPKTPKH